jgi:hypothetical protein
MQNVSEEFLLEIIANLQKDIEMLNARLVVVEANLPDIKEAA